MNLSCGFYCQFLFTIAYCRYDGDNLYLDLSARYISDFNPHPPYAGDDPPQVRAISTRAYFNPHPPMRGMTGMRASPPTIILFQSTSPYAGDDIPKNFAKNCGIRYFNPHPPYAGDDKRLKQLYGGYTYFNSHPPTWGMTIDYNLKCNSMK